MPGAGQVVAGKYRLERELGRGGMGSVWVATHVATLRPFAVKLLRPELAGDGEAEARFFREATLASSIHHPAIVEVYDVGRFGDTPYMVMKLLSGQTLRQRIKQGAIEPEQALELLIPVLEGVAAAHASGVVHRDLKPDNVVLHEQGGVMTPKILDFGISKLLGVEQREKLTKTGISLGTPLYMAPEQMRGDKELDGRVDVYALGVILYQMLSGALPYYGKTYADLVIAVMSGGAQSVRARNPKVAPALDAIVMRAIATNRDDRQASVAELLAQLQGVRGAAETDDPGHVTESMPMRDTSTPFTVEARAAWSPTPASRAKLWLAASGVLMLLLGVGGALWPSGAPDSRAGAPHVVSAAAAPAPAKREPTPAETELAPAKPEPARAKAEPVIAVAPPPAAPAPDAPAVPVPTLPQTGATPPAAGAPLAPSSSAHEAAPARHAKSTSGQASTTPPATPAATQSSSSSSSHGARKGKRRASELIDPFQ